MSSIAVVTDSNSGIKPNEYIDKDIYVLPMPIIIDEEEFFEETSLTQDDFYKKLDSNPNVNVKTSQPSAFEVTELWNELLKKYEQIIYIPMSSSLSSSTETAILLSKDFENKVFVVDNKRISLTLKASVLEAATMAKKNKTAGEIVNYLLETQKQSSIYISVDTLKYLKKGGRLNPAVAMIGTMLKIRPVLQIQGGKLDNYARAFNIPQAKQKMVQAIKDDLENRFSDLVKENKIHLSVAYTKNLEQAEMFKRELESTFPNIPVDWIDPLSLSVACHIGPNSLAVACYLSNF